MATAGITLALAFLFLILYFLIHHPAGATRNNHLPHGWSSPFLLVALVIFALLYRRYMFALPLQAMWGGRKQDAVDASVPAAAGEPRVVLVVALAEVLLSSVAPYYPLHLSVVRFGVSSWQRQGYLLLDAVLVSVAVTWFMLLKTALLEQIRDQDGPSTSVHQS